MAQIIFLHGASSAGKSTLAQAIQDAADQPFFVLSIDQLKDGGALPNQALAEGRFQWAEMRASFFEGFHRAIAGFAAAGNNVILEHILDTPGWEARLRDLLAPFDVLFVGVHCPLHILEEREMARGDRPLGSAAQDHANVHTGRIYDMEVDGTAPPEENAARILATLESRTHLPVFPRARSN